MADAEDAVQETYLRWHATDRERVFDPKASLMTTTARICLDMLTSARARREEYVGPWLSEPVVDSAALAPDIRVSANSASSPPHLHMRPAPPSIQHALQFLAIEIGVEIGRSH